MKKLLLVIAASMLSVATLAQTAATPIMRYIPLLSGYNVLVNTNATAIGIGSTNVLFTTYNGQVLYSLTNNVVNGVLNTNTIAPDAFKLASLRADANGDIVANASVYILVGSTNWFPPVVTNSVGQYMLTNWLLSVQQFPNWMFPATTNYYPTMTTTWTNTFTVNLYRVPSLNPQGGLGAGLGPTLSPLIMDDSVSSFSFVVTPTAAALANGGGYGLITNLPTSWTQGAASIYATITLSTNLPTLNPSQVINTLGILQPQP